MRYFFVTIFSIAMTISCNTDKKQSHMEQPFGVVDGKEVKLYCLYNAAGDTIKVTNYGGIITHWITADHSGKSSSIVLGFDSLTPYLHEPPYFGAIVGRYANRIRSGQFMIGNALYNLARNDGPNALHGGVKGFDKVVWNVDSITQNKIVLSYLSKDMEEGYPGNLKVKVSYTLTDKNSLIIDYRATTDKPTVVNLTQHSYFNLTGDPSRTILDHSLQIDASQYTPVDSTLIPLGRLDTVLNTPFDFRHATAIGARIAKVPGGYDHNYILNKTGSDGVQKAAVLSEATSGRELTVYTTEPGLQFYSGNFLDGKFFNKHTGLCLETQHYPNSPNMPAFPSTLLRPGEAYHSVTIYQLEIKQ